jgi:hypothetical protein
MIVIVTSRSGATAGAGGTAATVGAAGVAGVVSSRFGDREHDATTATQATQRAHVMAAMYSNELARDVPDAPTRMRNTS